MRYACLSHDKSERLTNRPVARFFSVMMLGAQASPPARVPRKPDRERRLFEGVDATELVTFDAGSLGPRSQHDDAHIAVWDFFFANATS
jgi:hypothetical protein